MIREMKMPRFLIMIMILALVLCSASMARANGAEDPATPSSSTESPTEQSDNAEQSNNAEQPGVPSSNEAPVDYELLPGNLAGPAMRSPSANVSSGDANRVLLIQETLPWKSEANQSVLDSLNMSYTVIPMSQFASTDLTGYYLVIVANDQKLDFYTDYNSVKAKLAGYVQGGGVLLMGACDTGWANGTIASGLPGGVQFAPKNYDYYNVIADSSHPIVTGELTDNVKLTNADLYSQYVSHREFDESTLPEGSKIILQSRSTHRPTLVEYPLGKGTVIASGLTWEYNWKYHTGGTGFGTFARKAMDDLFAYAASLANPAAGYEYVRQAGVEYEQTSSPVTGVAPPQIHDIGIEVLDEDAGKYKLTINDYAVDRQAGAEPFFFWKTADGYFSGFNDDYTSVEFVANPGTSGKSLEISAYAGDNLGYIGFKTVAVQGSRISHQDGVQLQLTSQPAQLKGWDRYDIQYDARLIFGGKVVPGTSVDIYYTVDGTSWQPVTSGLISGNRYTWLVPNVNAANVRLKLVAQNGAYIKSIESDVFSIAPSYYIEGKVLDKAGHGAAGVSVSAGGAAVVTDSDGSYFIKVTGPGSYSVQASKTGIGFVKSSFDVTLDGKNYYDTKIFRVK